VILSTHIVSDVEAAATEIAILNQGHLLRHALPEVLLRSVEGKVWEWMIPSADLTAARQRHIISSAVRRSDGVHVRLISEAPPDPEARSVPPALEDAYLHWIATGRDGGGR